ncbi:MAG: calcineurin-like phosphoesterase C-terminal domain-containing protein [Alistipes sp.]|nr:calcineurin-like phosphoesterase C-terminal domain-containing protein [Alistipes sp.]
MKQLLTYIFLLGITLLSIATTSAQERGFNLIVVGDTQPQTEEQFERLEREVVPNIELIIKEYRQKSNLPIIVLITGDVVWDNMAFLPRLKELFSSLDVELITVIGNHDHDRNTEGDESAKEQAYKAAFGARYKSFTLGDTRFILLDNILYHSYENYSIELDKEQQKWLRGVAKDIAKNERVAICMHAPAYSFREGKMLPYARDIMRMFRGHELHFITGHRHRHATVELDKNSIEHSVAQVCGNLWFAPLCTDGTPPGVLCIEERNDVWQWHFRTFDKEQQKLRIWHEGEVKDNEEYVVVKVIGWDNQHRVEWSENGVKMGAMEQITILDPDYIYYVENEADYNDTIMQRLRRSAHPHSHYFRCKRTSPDSEITISVTDRFGREFKCDMRSGLER